jgi:hypothetical protein
MATGSNPVKDVPASAGVISTVELAPLDRAWIVQSLKNQAIMLGRSRNKEITGGEVWILRGKEIDQIHATLAKIT